MKMKDIDFKKLYTVSRFLSKVRFGQHDDSCWEWIATTTSGYGQFRHPVTKGIVYSHIYMLELMGVDMPEGQETRHLCDNRACINPAHLTVGTHKENMEDMRRLKIPEMVRSLRENGYSVTKL